MNLSANKCRNFAIISLAAGVISLIAGGALLSTAGFLVGFMAFLSSRKLEAANPEDIYAHNAFNLSKIAMVVCLVITIASLMTVISGNVTF